MRSLKVHNSAGAKQTMHPPKQKAVIQPKLMVNAPGDRYEQEADAMAERVIRMHGHSSKMQPSTGMIGKSVQRKCAKCEEEQKKKGEAEMRKMDISVDQPISFSSSGSIGANHIHRKCAHCEEEEKRKKSNTIMRKAESGGRFEASSGLTSQLVSRNEEGSPLPAGTKLFMENAFSTDFSHVRIHTDNSAVTMNKEVNAKAFTYGNDIYFDSGQFAPESVEGKRLFAHELTHVIQQSDSIQRDDTNNLLTLPALQLPVPISLNQSVDVNALSNQELVQEITNILEWIKRNSSDSEQIMNLEYSFRNLVAAAFERNINPFGHVEVTFRDNLPWAFDVEGNPLDVAVAFEIYGGIIPVERKEAYDFSAQGMKGYFLSNPNLLKPLYKDMFRAAMNVIFERDITGIEDRLFELSINAADEAWLISKVEWWSQTKDMLLDDTQSYFDAFLERLQQDKWYKDYLFWESDRKPYLDLLYNEVEERSGELNTLIGQNSVKFGGYRPLWTTLDIKGEVKEEGGTV
ncbi:MAG: DUF4157 domain-containing protein, partial [Segetibacter sp.]